MSQRLTIIVAATKSHGIGRNGKLPWRLSKEISYFARITTKAPDDCANAVIMGRKTWESIPTKFRPLPRRINAVISRNTDYDLGSDGDSAFLETSLQSGLQRLANYSNKLIHRQFVIGGTSIFNEVFSFDKSGTTGYVDRILLTRILSPAFDECDVFMPDFAAQDKLWRRATHGELEEWAGFEVAEGTQVENGVEYEFQMWVR